MTKYRKALNLTEAIQRGEHFLSNARASKQRANEESWVYYLDALHELTSGHIIHSHTEALAKLKDPFLNGRKCFWCDSEQLGRPPHLGHRRACPWKESYEAIQAAQEVGGVETVPFETKRKTG